MTNRRQFLWNCSALALTASLAPAAVWPPTAIAVVTLDQLSLAAFLPQVGTSFRVAEPAVALKLVEARPLPMHRLAPGAADARNEKFSLLFTGPKNVALTQNTHRFTHATLGAFAMFIVPVGHQDSSRVYYEAVFNRPVRETSI